MFQTTLKLGVNTIFVTSCRGRRSFPNKPQRTSRYILHGVSAMASKEQTALKSVLLSESEPSTAARAFAEPTKKALVEDGDIEGTLESAWRSLIEVAADTAHESQAPLINTLRELQVEDISAEVKGKPCNIWGEDVKVWTDMPLLGASFREAWNKAPGSGSRDDFSASQWTNLNAFLARLTALSSPIAVFDFSLYAVWTLRTAVEGINDAKPEDAEAAKAWFTYARESLQRFSEEGKNFDGNLARPGDKYEGKNWRGFNAERLGIWQTALQ